MHLGYYDDSVTVQDSISASCLGNPAFSARQRYDACRCSFRPLPPCICGELGKAGWCVLGVSALPLPDSSRELSCGLGRQDLFELEFRQYSLHHAPLTLTILRETISLQTAWSDDALFTAPFRALLHYWRRLTPVGTGDVSTPDSCEYSSLPLMRRTLRCHTGLV